MGKDIIAMSVREVKRAGVLQEVLERRITQRKAAEILGRACPIIYNILNISKI